MISKGLVFLCLTSWAAAQQSVWGQCGGINWTGATTCVSGATCTYQNDWYSQCLPTSSSTSSSTSRSSSSSSSTRSSSTSSRASSTSSSTSSRASSTSSSLSSSRTSSASTSTSTSTSTRTSSSSSKSTSSTSSTASSSPTGRTGKLPALGWNSWNAYHGDINEAKVVAAANQFITLGLKDVGYQYINIDDCWSNITGRDTSTNKIRPDLNKFPNGIASVASTIHSLGLLLGIYGDAGTATCAGYPGSLGYEDIDAATFAAWGVDYLKYDNCNVPSNWTDYWTYDDWGQSNSAKRYRQMGTALAAQSRPIQFSLCIWGAAQVWTWGATVGQSWRMSGDSSATWSYITSIINSNSYYLDYVNFYAHNDMDMMEIGNGALTIQEQRSHFAMWVALKSPILLGTDLSLLTTAQLNIIKNKELLAFSQDATVGAPAKPYGTATTTPPEYYAGQSSKGTHVFILNTSASSSSKTITFASVTGLASASTYKIHDMWTGSDVTVSGTSWSTTLDAHDTGAWLITPS
ncbi:hypothetical protein FRB91_006523 [Serendipita sp. 411]|nr:hypothetical protein FRC19_000007 [Serendipita sp. 401]KAG8852428.1 hypothetical protein FRB91_006523 [Serendipita sp. 411]KAG9058928.1 hypothetical protein FS842_000126 [Serendipita sp. 407]